MTGTLSTNSLMQRWTTIQVKEPTMVSTHTVFALSLASWA
jgi:hypothetical protein